MTIDEIERRLRLPAPDEPAVLPALMLPIHVGVAPLSGRAVDLRLGRRRRSMPMVLLGAVLLLGAALVGAVLTGALRLERLRDALPIPGVYTGRGITLDYPDDWTRLTPPDPLGSGGSSVALIVGNRELDGCEPDSAAVALNSPPPQEPPDAFASGSLGNQQGVIFDPEDRIYACVIEQPLGVGEIRVIVSRDRPQAIGVGPIGDFQGTWLAPNPEIGPPVLVNAEMGFTESVGEMPARLIVRNYSVVPGAEQVRTWIVAIPKSADSLWWIQAVMRGPDLEALEADVDAIARSLTFDEAPTLLIEADRDKVLARAIDAADRSMRGYPGRRFLGCMPRTPGSVTATIRDGPRGRLELPLEVTCTTTVQSNDLRVWEAMLEVEWAANSEHDAGRWARQILFDGEGLVFQETDVAPGTGVGLAFPGDPSVPDGTSVIASFLPGDLVRSIGEGSGTAFYDVDTARLPPEPHLYAEPGALVVILSGPEVYDGRDFYVADNGFELGWVGAEAKGRAVLEPAEPMCPPTIDATELAYLSSLERHACVIGELVLGPVQAAQDPVDQWRKIDGDPAWLASEQGWVIYGAAGAHGIDRSLPVVLAPGLEPLATDGWLRITGHFDDPASAHCTIRYPADWDGPPIPPEAQVRRCQERFVVTTAEPTEGP